MYFHKPQEKPHKWGSFQDVQYAVMKNCEKIYGVDPDSIVLAMPLFWGLPCLDYSGKRNDGVNHGAYYKDGGLELNGTDDYVNIADNNDFTPTAGLTVLCQFKANSLGAENEGLVAHYEKNVQRSWVLMVDNQTDANHHIGGALSATGNYNASYAVSGSSNLVVGTQYCGTLVWIPSVSAKVYLDGSLDGTAASSPASLHNANIAVWLGLQYFPPGDGSQAAVTLHGFIYESHVFNIALTADQIALFHDRPWALYQPVQRPVYFFQAAEGISIPVAMQNMRGGFNPIGMRGGFINAD